MNAVVTEARNLCFMVKCFTLHQIIIIVIILYVLKSPGKMTMPECPEMCCSY